MKNSSRRDDRRRQGNGQGGITDLYLGDVRFEVTEKGLDFLGYKTLRIFSAVSVKVSPDGMTLSYLFDRC